MPEGTSRVNQSDGLSLGARHSRWWLIGLPVLLLIVSIAAIDLSVYMRMKTMIYEATLSEARSYADLVVYTRRWNAQHGGVYVLKGPHAPSNRYLRSIGIEPDTSTVSGALLTLRNPAMMTNEISSIVASGTEGTFFRLVSLNPVNPAGAPDPWEREQLIAFNRRVRKAPFEVTRLNGVKMFRTARPLYVERSCLPCHAIQGYEFGDVRGAIVVNVPFEDVDKELRADLKWSIGLGFAGVLGILVGAYVLAWRPLDRREASEHVIEQLAVTDDLTELPNRRAAFERLHLEFDRAARTHEPLAVFVFDVDFFKRVNDQYGHAAGDLALRTIAHRMRDAVRPYDLLARFGGEEFLLVAPDTDRAEAEQLAERILRAVRGEPLEIDGKSLGISLSGGFTVVSEADQSIDIAITRADEALYRSKETGRDRVTGA